MRKQYPSDITREQFNIILPLLEGARKKTKPRQVDLYEIFCGVLYVLKTGCQWRALPSDIPKWRTVYSYFEIWTEEKKIGKKTQPTVLDVVLKKISWRGAYSQWSEGENKHDHRGRSKR